MAHTLIYFENKELKHLMVFTSMSDEEGEAIEQAINLIKEDYEVITPTDFLQDSDVEYKCLINHFKYTITTIYCDEICQVYANNPTF